MKWRTLTLINALIYLAWGCAGVHIPLTHDEFPFRAEFDLNGSIQGKKIHYGGAVVLASQTQGLAQLYGPGGLTLYTLKVDEGLITIDDVWGVPLAQYEIPRTDLIGLMAGTVPGGPYLFKRKKLSSQILTYTWGSLVLDERLLPEKLHVRNGDGLDIYFDPQGETTKLNIFHGSDTLQLSLSIIQGGRW